MVPYTVPPVTEDGADISAIPLAALSGQVNKFLSRAKTRVRHDHALHAIRRITSEELASLSGRFTKMRWGLGLIRFRGHIPKEGYDVHDVHYTGQAGAPAL